MPETGSGKNSRATQACCFQAHSQSDGVLTESYGGGVSSQFLYGTFILHDQRLATLLELML